LEVFDAESKEKDLILAVPILVLLIDAVEVKLIDAFETQCKSIVDK
jgi:predicted Kef-type K+ transport protein